MCIWGEVSSRTHIPEQLTCTGETDPNSAEQCQPSLGLRKGALWPQQLRVNPAKRRYQELLGSARQRQDSTWAQYDPGTRAPMAQRFKTV